MKKSLRVSAFMTMCIVLLFFINENIISQQPGGGGEANPGLKTNKEALARWQDMRFGMFIHWGPVTLRGTEIGWSRGEEIPVAEYDNLYKEFNPVLFNAADWVKAAKDAGMKYLVIVSKHHDGFCLWDSKYTDYNIMNTPFRRDVLRELSDECRKQGIMFCTYYSIADWHHKDYATRHGRDSRSADESSMSDYIKFLKNQISELIMKYGTNILWFDGEWEGAWTHEYGMDLYRYCRSLRNDILINNRVDKGRDGMRGNTISNKYAGDFGTPEQEIGNYNTEHPWESCITICKQWSWKPNDSIKSVNDCIQILARTVGGGGNLLLNVSPMLDGRMEQRQTDHLRKIGQWLMQYGESIYGTKGGPYKLNDQLASTRKGNRIFIHLFNWPKGKLILPLLKDRKIKSAKIMGGAKLEFQQDGRQILITTPAGPTDPSDSVIVLELDGDAMNIETIETSEAGK